MKHLLSLGLLFISVVAAADEGITPSINLPKTTPWDLKTLSEPPAFKWLDAAGTESKSTDSKDTVRSLMYEGEAYRGKPTRVFAWYATPATLSGEKAGNKQFPGVVCIHGGGGTAFREWAELWAKRGYAAIAMDLAGHRPVEGKDPHSRENRTRLPDGGPNQTDEEKFFSIAQPPSEQWPYHAVASAVRAHSLIRSFPEVDPDRTAVTGISWGGYLTCIVAGVDDRFKAAVPVYGCGFLHENSVWLPRFAKMTPEDRERWITLWDPSRYLPAVSMPILFINGTNDAAYPLDSYMKSYDAVRGTKQIRVTVNMPHSHPEGWAPKEIGLFIDHHLRGGEPLPSVGEPKNGKGIVQLSCTSPAKIKEAALHFTTDDSAINKREWQSKPAKIEGDSITVESPPAEATAWFITVTDERGATVSTRVIIGQPK